MTRAAILSKIRTALGADAEVRRQQVVAARRADPPRHPIPARCVGPAPELLAAFKAHLAAQGADLITVTEAAQIPSAVAGYLRARHLPLDVRMGSDPSLAALPWGDAPELAREVGAARPDDGAGLSRAVAGVAETGTLLLASGADNPVTLAFVPDTHLIVVQAAKIVGAYEDAIALLKAELGGAALPRTLNLVSGASRTGDIGGRIVMGAHGPRRLAVIIVDKG